MSWLSMPTMLEPDPIASLQTAKCHFRGGLKGFLSGTSLHLWVCVQDDQLGRTIVLGWSMLDGEILNSP